jgi:hypothetical protein
MINVIIMIGRRPNFMYAGTWVRKGARDQYPNERTETVRQIGVGDQAR